MSVQEELDRICIRVSDSIGECQLVRWILCSASMLCMPI